MKRYDVVLGRSGGRPHARCDETPEGAYVRHYVAQRLIDAKQAEIDALKAQNAELLAAQQWQPIESAPKDQTVLLAGEFAGEGDWRIKCGYFCSERNFWCIWGASWTPTHWQPLPPLPERARGDL